MTLVAWFGSLSPLIYFMTAMPTVVFLTTLTPPFQTPDETNHFRREVQLLRGELVGHDITSPGFSGAKLPKNVVRVAESFSYLISHADEKFSPAVMREAAAIPWNWSDREFTSFANTVIYPPFFYIPSVAALAVAQQLDWAPLGAYELARLTTAIVAVSIATLAIGLAGRGRAILFVVLSFPTTLYLFASVSQDSLLIACSALAMGLCSRAASSSRALTTIERVSVALLLGAIIAARPPYVFLAVVLTGPSVLRSGVGLQAYAKVAIPCLTALLIGACWILFGARPSQTPMRLEAGVSIPGQISFLLSHPASFPITLVNTIVDKIGVESAQAIAVLGWSETLFSPLYYVFAGLALAVAMALTLSNRRGAPSSLWSIILLAAGCCVFIGLQGALYLQWTPVGASVVDGFQGRYLVPPLTLLTIALPSFGSRAPGSGMRAFPLAARCRAVGWFAIFCFVVISDLWLPHEVFLRYYG